MHSRLHTKLVALALIPLMAGCQSTRHSNTMVFGTNTTVGLKVGTNVNQVPEIMLAYDRQEAVIMPLVANTQDNGQYQSPCNIESLPAGTTDHPCLLIGRNAGSQDTYSVLASFGAEFGASVKGTDPSASGGLAQYFATGIAAQILAAKGGASVVAVGGAAAKAAENNTDNSVASLFASAEQIDAAKTQKAAYEKFREMLLGKFVGKDDAAVNAYLVQLETRLGFQLLSGPAAICNTRASCESRIVNGIYQGRYNSSFDSKL